MNNSGIYRHLKTTRRKNKSIVYFITILLLSTLISNCKEQQNNPNKNIQLSQFDELKDQTLSLDISKMRQQCRHLAINDNDSTQTDHITRKLYKSEFTPVWVNRYGVDSCADTLLAYLKTVNQIGFSEKAFFTSKIEKDLKRLRLLDFGDQDINTIAARLEYHLTKAFLRYCTGQRFGFTNPYSSLNHLDPIADDSTVRIKEYRHLFDIPIERPDKAFYSDALRNVVECKTAEFLHSVQPDNTTLEELRQMLNTVADSKKKRRILCKMERHRWRRTPLATSDLGRKVVVNIPAFTLYAYSPDSVMTMKIGCGSTKTKTPLLTSQISRMDINPQWNIPMSIIKKDVAKHAGNSHYFDSHRYFIVERETGKRIDPSSVTTEMLKSGKYRVTQEGGKGNSLGRIIFRFNNNFSVYLHDTSNRKFFSQAVRSVSHGCIRVEKPFELAQFLLNDNVDEWTLDKIRISMDMTPQTDKGIRYVSDTTRSRKLINSKSLQPNIPLYIIYQTMSKTSRGNWETYPDIYGFDAVTSRQLAPFLDDK